MDPFGGCIQCKYTISYTLSGVLFSFFLSKCFRQQANRLLVICTNRCHLKIMRKRGTTVISVSSQKHGVFTRHRFGVKLYLNNIIKKKNWWNVLIWVTGHCNRAAVSRNRYGVEKTVDTHTILINAIKFYVCLQEI